MEDKRMLLQPILDKYNANHDDPSFTPMQKYVLDKINAVQGEMRAITKAMDEENAKITEAQKKVDDMQLRVVNLDGQNQSFLDMLAKIQEDMPNG